MVLSFFKAEMGTKKRRILAQILSQVVVAGGLCVMAGWILDIEVLKSIRPTWISMKFDTAVAFILSGISLYFLVQVTQGKYDPAVVILPVTSLIIILLMGIFLFSTILQVHTGLEDIFIEDVPDAVKSVVGGRPSIPTMVNFILIGIASLVMLLNPETYRLRMSIIGVVITVIGAVAIVGYCIDLPMLFYYIEGINSAIAFHTAALFVLLGIGLLCL